MTDILCVVEIAKGSRNKYEWSPEHGRFLLDRFLSSSVVFPTDYGFIPDTETPDGDPRWEGRESAERVIAEAQDRATV